MRTLFQWSNKRYSASKLKHSITKSECRTCTGNIETQRETIACKEPQWKIGIGREQ